MRCYMAASCKDWKPRAPNSRMRLGEIDIESGLARSLGR